MSESDKYPMDSGRRRFVKGVVGGATLVGAGATGATTINLATAPAGEGGGATEMMAIEQTGGPAPNGMPQIPIEIDDEGFLKGVWPEVKTETQEGVQIKVAEMNLGGVTYSGEWFQYCGLESYGGIDPQAEEDNFLRSDANPPYSWQSDAYSEGDKLHVDDFSDYKEWGNEVGADGVGKPATGTWRSQESDDTLPIQVIRSERIEQKVQNDEWLQASTQNGFIAWMNKCTHFCCVPGYKQTADAARYGAANGVYCQCHQSTYDPFTIVQELFIARPRPTDSDDEE
ncbi:ubiquinol-cytochrome c reductase iron-sulfur subunit [Halegenticoccus tardaugens]|uniref:ubiquinol-cytochrome c reductase iron-sulfur subunit n=1 Tax=Halegenticoccus tardaugens TaxID=2071624 RepID=UPI00100BA4CD|nr:ubiquinol-cytochrome c reductase iron-sulfur subunit [Halegenticoccus tardaugens]